MSSSARADTPALWRAVDELVDRAPDLAALRWHGLHLLAARRWRAQGKAVPPELAREEALAEVRTLLAPALLAQIREVCDGPLVVFKGPEVATRYPAPDLRPFIDIDFLVADPEQAHATLVEHGFEEAPDPPWAADRRRERDPFEKMHHTRPLQPPKLPLKIELHRWPSWPRWLTPPPPRAVLAHAAPSALGVDGVMTLSPASHALVLAAHSWVNDPLGRLRDLIDVTLLAAESEREEIAALAADWGIARLWSSTIEAADAALMRAQPPTLAQRTWARNLRAVRERTVLEAHLENWISSYWTTPPREATRLALSNVIWDLRPAAGEPWRKKLRRAARAFGHALSPKSAHDAELGTDARRFSPVTRWRRPPGPGDT